jgi:hypothetical protein
MTEPRRLEPVTFLHGTDSPVTRPDVIHPSLGLNEQGNPRSFRDYYEKNKQKVAAEPTEEQLAFRNHVQSGTRLTVDPQDAPPLVIVESISEPDPEFSAPEADIPEF